VPSWQAVQLAASGHTDRPADAAPAWHDVQAGNSFACFA
jgi:hypothetical protein